MIKLCKRLKEYLIFIKENDSSRKSLLEILIFCESIRIMYNYRIAHFLYTKKMYFFAYIIMKRVKRKFIIDFHPGAIIGKNFFIDHGLGVVIGETTIIGDNCVIYQNVTLGAVKRENGKRHPSIGNNVLIGAGAIILGNITIEDDVKIGAGAIVLENIERGSTVVCDKAHTFIK